MGVVSGTGGFHGGRTGAIGWIKKHCTPVRNAASGMDRPSGTSAWKPLRAAPSYGTEGNIWTAPTAILPIGVSKPESDGQALVRRTFIN